jgi:hypothetical protein
MSDPSMITELTENFILLHKNQLVSNGIPEAYWNTLFIKLKDEVILSNLTINLFELKASFFLWLDF